MTIITLSQLTVFFLILARIAGLFMYAPIFSSKEIFSLGKICLIFWISGLIIYVIPLPQQLPDAGITFSLALIVEFLVGVSIGFVIQLILIGIEFAGGLMDTQSGLSAASILDPSSGHTVTIISRILRWVAIMIFIKLDGHLMILSLIFESYRLIPVASPVKLDQSMRLLSGLGTNIFALALQFSAPILLIVFLIDFCFGMLNKISPQINVFNLAMEVKPSISFFILMAILPSITDETQHVVTTTMEMVLRLLMAMKP